MEVANMKRSGLQDLWEGPQWKRLLSLVFIVALVVMSAACGSGGSSGGGVSRPSRGSN